MPRYKCPRCGGSNSYGGDPYPCSICGFDGRVVVAECQACGHGVGWHTPLGIGASRGCAATTGTGDPCSCPGFDAP